MFQNYLAPAIYKFSQRVRFYKRRNHTSIFPPLQLVLFEIVLILQNIAHRVCRATTTNWWLMQYIRNLWMSSTTLKMTQATIRPSLIIIPDSFASEERACVARWSVRGRGARVRWGSNSWIGRWTDGRASGGRARGRMSSCGDAAAMV